ncbi:MAG: hypothetical protein LH472_04630 [Pyrinomonadaceae bacterium]|nr:hypothetical protein [Pyrinomonadaceae bacterium]
MSIRTNIEDKQTEIDEERAVSPTGDSAIANDLQGRAAAAVRGDEGAWDNYMKTFAKDSTEMARLQPDPAGVPNSPQNLARAYLIGNGICGPASPGGTELSFTVGDTLDF